MGSTGGWNRPAANQPMKKGGAKTPTAMRGVVAILAVAAIAAVCVFIFMGKSENPVENEAEKQTKGKVVRTSKPQSFHSDDVVKSDIVKPQSRSSNYRAEVEKPKISGTQMSTNIVMVQTNRTVVKRHSPFRSQMEMILRMALPKHPGQRMPPVPIFGNDNDESDIAAQEADIEKGLKNVLKGEVDDAENDLWVKADVSLLKDEFKELHAQGYTLRQYVAALQEKFNQDADFLSEAQQLVSKNYDDESISDEEYLKFKDKVDKLLSDRGLPATVDDQTEAALETESQKREKGDK